MRSMHWGIPAMVLAAVYFYAAAICTTIVSDGGPGWLYLLVLLFVCYAVVSAMSAFSRWRWWPAGSVALLSA